MYSNIYKYIRENIDYALPKANTPNDKYYYNIMLCKCIFSLPHHYLLANYLGEGEEEGSPPGD